MSNIRGVSPYSEAMSDTLERNRGEKALLTKTPSQSQVFLHKTNSVKNYSDKNGNDVTKALHKGRRTFAFWTLVCLLFVLAIGNLVLTFTILAVLRLGQGLESMEFLPEHNAMKLFGSANLDHVYKRDGLIESFRDTPMSLTSENGSVLFNLQTRLSRAETKLAVNSSGVFVRGVSSLELTDPDSGEQVFSTASAALTLGNSLNNLNAKASAHLRGAEGTHMESKELFWKADQDIYLKSINGSVVLSGKEGVFIDVRYLPIALPLNKTEKFHGTGQFKVCVCMPQGKLFRIAVPNGQKVTCSHVNMTDDMNPCA
ncbi:jg19668 [Pararge aegeria aegeria]|uniref:Beta-sarcoglycan n=1 Tax=Pararge aegeria aegeria TaxID=348720 RepID=A0A8S4S4R5_9NEOP|nr:jg19668 [Pararge aegeria aegeria]